MAELLLLDITLVDGSIHKLRFCEGDSENEVAATFALRHRLGQDAIDMLVDLIRTSLPDDLPVYDQPSDTIPPYSPAREPSESSMDDAERRIPRTLANTQHEATVNPPSPEPPSRPEPGPEQAADLHHTISALVPVERKPAPVGQAEALWLSSSVQAAGPEAQVVDFAVRWQQYLQEFNS